MPGYRERLAVFRSHFGQLLDKLGDHESAREAFDSAVELLEQLVQYAPDVVSYQNELAFVYSHLGALLQETGDSSGAEQALREAERRWQALVTESPSPEPEYFHNLAWFLVNCPDSQFRDPERAIELAQQAIDHAPQNATYHNTLGAAHYRAGKWPAAVDALQEAIKLRGQGNGRDWFFLSMAEWQSGETEEARTSYANGLQWMEENRPGNAELKRIRDEAAQLIGVAEEEDQEPQDPGTPPQ
jgi:tetratricopeptide (TPR) repeat protein